MKTVYECSYCGRLLPRKEMNRCKNRYMRHNLWPDNYVCKDCVKKNNDLKQKG